MRQPYIHSPCVDVCRIDQKTGLCEGCFRTLDEICVWTRMSDAERAAIMNELPSRHEASQKGR